MSRIGRHHAGHGLLAATLLFGPASLAAQDGFTTVPTDVLQPTLVA